MKKEIEKNKFYELYIDTEKNRAFLKIKGFWHSVNDVPMYITHWKQVSRMLKNKFTILLDSREAVTHPPEVQKLRQDAQEIAVKGGMYKAAEIVSSNIIAEFQSDSMSKQTHYDKAKFKSQEEAEKWLNEVLND